MSKLDAVVMRIDPYQRTITKVKISGRDFSGPMRRLTRATQLGHRLLLELEDKRVIGQRPNGRGGVENFDAGPMKLCVAADASLDKGEPGWRMRGGETTVGYSVLFGATPNGTVSTPVDIEWVEKHLVWVDAAEADAEEEAEG